MIIRFFSILQRNWTYEVEYGLEVSRMFFINITTLLPLFVILRVESIPKWLKIVLIVVLMVCWWYYLRYSIGRFIQIRNNKKYAIMISREQLIEVFNEYPKQKLYCKVNGKYRKITSENGIKELDEILLITIGKKQIYNLKKITKIINRNDD